MDITEYKKKAQYFRELGQTAIADDIDELILRVKFLENEKEKLSSIISMLLTKRK